MDTVITCPLGSECEEIRDNKLHRCRWFIKMQGTDAQGKAHDEWNCAMSWQPILQLEVAMTNRQTASSVQSMRNANDSRQHEAIQALRSTGNARIDKL